MGRDFLGTYDLFADALLLFERGVHDRVTEPVRCSGLDDPQLPRLLPKAALAKLRKEVEMAKGLCPPMPYGLELVDSDTIFCAASWQRINEFGCIWVRDSGTALAIMT